MIHDIYKTINHLFAESVIGCNKSVALAVDGWIGTSTNGIHFPVSIIIVHHMEIPKPTPAKMAQFFSFSNLTNVTGPTK